MRATPRASSAVSRTGRWKRWGRGWLTRRRCIPNERTGVEARHPGWVVAGGHRRVVSGGGVQDHVRLAQLLPDDRRPRGQLHADPGAGDVAVRPGWLAGLWADGARLDRGE